MIADAGVGSGERVLPMAEGTDPESGAVVDASVGVEDRSAIRADQGVVIEEREIDEREERRVESA